MSDWVYIVTSALTLLGVIVSAVAQSRATMAKLDKQSELADARMEAKIERYAAVTDTKIDELTREVREHNNFARRVPVLEEQMKAANHRIDDLEKKTE